MPARRVPALALPVDPQAEVSFRGYEHRTPLLTIATARPALLVTLTLPESGFLTPVTASTNSD